MLIVDYDISVLSQFVELFDSSFARMIRAYFELVGVPLEAEDEDEPKKQGPQDSEEDHVGTILVCYLSVSLYCLLLNIYF